MSIGTIVLVGPGAVGCGIAALLRKGGADVALLDHRPERAALLSERGVILELDGTARTVHLPCSADPGHFAPAALVLILVKAHATEDAIGHALPCVGPDTPVLTLQNGLGNWEAVVRHVRPAQVLAGTVVIGCNLLATGHVRVSGVGEMTFGSPTGFADAARRARELLAPHWPSLHVVEDIHSALWRKAVINAAINPLTALTGLHNGELLDDPDLRATLRVVAEEAQAVAQAEGAAPFRGDGPEVVEGVCRLTAGNRSSMLQDILAGRPTEIDQIVGEIVRRAAMRAVPVPMCRALLALVRAVQRRTQAPDGRT
jgi:2-dehydropantoate 2-reductase